MHRATRPNATRFNRIVRLFSIGLVASALGGCAALTQPIEGVPAKRLPADFFPEPKNDFDSG